MGPVGGPKGGYLIKDSTKKKDYVYNIAFKESKDAEKSICVYGIDYHNLKNIDVKIPYGKISCISGVSGSGKVHWLK